MRLFDWKSIRPLNGAQHKGFEELCVQLARGAVPAGCAITRNGTPDGGVECYCVLNSGEEWGWQSKYVDMMDASQWAQIDDSVKTALETHPRLVRYYICIPLDLPDARQKRKKSARDRWNDYKSKWDAWAAQLGMSVDFVLWGSSELLDMLSLSSNSGRVLFWFGSPGCFDENWFSNQAASATKSAGPRYTPELHVELPIARKFEAFGRTAAMVDRVRGTGSRLQEASRSISRWNDSELTPGLETICQPLKAALNGLMVALDNFEQQPSGSQGLAEIGVLSSQSIQACHSVERGLRAIDEHWNRIAEAKAEPVKKEGPSRSEAQASRLHTLRELEAALDTAHTVYTTEAVFAESQVLVLAGEAGMGKTHLLCDLARQRIAEKRPTVLLLGQSFTSTESPARQVATLLGVPNASLNEIVGCLEAAAQANHARCLILIDALNEGRGRHFWKEHLTAFVDAIKASPWLAVALSVRTCYLDTVIPEAILAEAAKAVHYGFEEVQHEAVKLFFLEHGLEFASTPVFSREFCNPLFLKTLCGGLQKSGCRTLPRGFHGITKVFGLYLNAMETELARRLDYAPQKQLVRKALHALVNEAAKTNQQFLPSDQGQEIVDGLLPGRNYSDSLYRALLDEGLLMESLAYDREHAARDVVGIAYERWADHLEAKALLDAHLDSSRPAEAFKKGGPLALYGNGISRRAGIMEAWSIQIPERVGRELLSLAPYGLHEYGMADAFLHSIVWRDPTACTPAMERLMNYIEAHNVSINADVWDTRITVATISGHAMNMAVTDRWLKSIPMPDRDADWTITIHKAWDQEHSICHLVDWALSLQRGAPLDEDSAWLAALTLCWCFTASHRFLRDRATKAAVNLLDDRLELVTHLVRHFAEVDDLYVRERVLAVACGTSVRSHNACAVVDVAEAVYDTVFALGKPPTHILLRDYARLVVERAVHLGGTLSFEPSVANPPYRSIWPTISTKEEIEGLKSDWQHIGKSLPDEEWARHEIFSSVLDGDFSRYVIGTNHGSSEWLSLRLSESRWTPASQQIDGLVGTFTKAQRQLWKLIEKVRLAGSPSLNFYIHFLRDEKLSPADQKQMETMVRREKKRKKLSHDLMKSLVESLSPEVSNQLNTQIQERDQPGGSEPPRFDLSLIQRYIINRVFDLGWTVDRFGFFDRSYVRDSGRSASKPERMGKKYQWIAYHEISALMTDHFQYREARWGGAPVESYEGPWQDWFRDIDPTHSIKALPERVKAEDTWWEPIHYANWESERAGQHWALDAADFPDVSRLLRVTDRQGAHWIKAYGFHYWERKRLPSQGNADVETRNLWIKFHAWLVKREDVQSLLDWAQSVNVSERWTPHQLPHDMGVFLGEHGWAKASRFHETPFYGHNGWHVCDETPVEVFAIPVEYLEETSTFDCSMDESFSLTLPAPALVRELGLRWNGKGADFVTSNGELFATDPSAHEAGGHCLLLREDLFQRYLNDNGLSVVWSVSGEKNRHGPRGYDDFFGLRFFGALELTAEDFRGNVCHEDLKSKQGE